MSTMQTEEAACDARLVLVAHLAGIAAAGASVVALTGVLATLARLIAAT